MATAADIPRKFDFLVNGEGYVFADAEQQKAVLGYTSPFIPRTSVQTGASGQPGYGDSDTEFFQTFTQKDWSKGEGQRYQGRDEDSGSRYWDGATIDVSREGQARLNFSALAVTPAAAIVAATGGYDSSDSIYYATSTNLYSITPTGTITDHGAHAATSPVVVEADPFNIFISGSAGNLRKWDGSVFSTFSATGSIALAFLNNTLYGMGDTLLRRYDTAGAATTIYTWQDSDGSGHTATTPKIAAYGGKLLILRSMEQGSGLYLYDGTAPALIHRFPPNFAHTDLAVNSGVVFVSGRLLQIERTATNTTSRAAVFYYANGTTGLLWEAENVTVGTDANMGSFMCGWRNGVVFTDPVAASPLVYYNPVTGGISHVGDVSGNTINGIASSRAFTLTWKDTVSAKRWPSETIASTAIVTTSLVDFDSSLTKAFRGISIEWDDDAADTGATVDISYRVGDVDGSYTSLQVGAVSGTEYTLSGVTGKSISVKVTLNKSGSTIGPTLKRIRVRAVPMRQPFRKDQAILNLQGRDGNNIRLRDGATHVKDGKAMATDLRTAATSAAPITIIDTFGSYTGIIESLELIEVRPEEFLARISFREV